MATKFEEVSDIPWEDECEKHRHIYEEMRKIIDPLKAAGIFPERMRCGSCEAERDPAIQYLLKKECGFTEH